MNKKTILIMMGISLMLSFSFMRCKDNDTSSLLDRNKLKIALKYADTNSLQLREVINHYSKNDYDSLKLRAAAYLIENMIGKGYYKLEKHTLNGKKVNFEVFDKTFLNIPGGIDSINALKKKYEDSTGCGEILYGNPQFVEDIKTITAQYLIENIDYAFLAWEKPWAKKLSFDEFKELILPYRFGSEPLQNWRKKMYRDGNWIYKETTDRLKMASYLNDSLHKIYKWYGNEKISYYPGFLTVDQLNVTQCGRCDDLNMLVAYWLRSIGVPTASEFTPYWGNSNMGGHSWISVLDTTSKFVPMNAIFNNPVRDSLPFGGAKIAKAYRCKYKLNEDFYATSQVKKSFYDITSEYLPVTDYTILLDTSYGNNLSIGVLNGFYWQPLSSEYIIRGDSITFKNLVKDVLYAPVVVLENGLTRTLDYPFFFRNTGEPVKLTEDVKNPSYAKIDISQCINNIHQKYCKVVFWDSDKQNWQEVGNLVFISDNPSGLRKKKLHKIIDFGSVPSKSVYRIIDIHNPISGNNFYRGNSYGRPFVYNKFQNSFISM